MDHYDKSSSREFKGKPADETTVLPDSGERAAKELRGATPVSTEGLLSVKMAPGPAFFNHKGRKEAPLAMGKKSHVENDLWSRRFTLNRASMEELRRKRGSVADLPGLFS